MRRKLNGFAVRFVLGSTLGVLALAASVSAPAQEAPQREVYFGETHLHTTWSIDAYAISGATYNGPAEAYRYARGETINHPLGYPITITQPLDWIGVTEHAGYLGAFMMAADPDSILRDRHPIAARSLDVGAGIKPLAAYMVLAKSMVRQKPIDAFRDPEVLQSMWRRIVDVADEYYEPGTLTTFPAYEWTAQPNNKNMHRNIFFRDSSKVPEQVIDAIMHPDPWDLWAWMDAQRAAGNELLAIGHNGNLSGGLMYPSETDLAGRPIDEAWAASRARNEPLAEIKQGKGQSETTPLLSPNDEFADYEVLEWVLLGDEASGPPKQIGSYLRRAYRDGLALQGVKGFNPHKFGIVAGSDTHNAAVGYRQKNYFGIHGVMDGTPEMRLSAEKQMDLDNRKLAPPGLSAVWAEENNREAIFDGLRRKETYATSGVRIRLRFFGGWDYAPDLLEDGQWTDTAYGRGVPMGGDLPARSGEAPTFVIHALKDPDSGHLDRIQVIKGWSDRGQSFEKIYDVAWSGERTLDPATHRVGDVGNTVNYANASYRNDIGAPELKVVWTDPDFDPSLDAFYYVRVLEIPTPRWPLIQARELGVAPPDGVALVTRERAWSAPIWYTPTNEARAGREAGVTVAQLLADGAEALDDVEIIRLIVGHTMRVTNLVSGRSFDIFYGTDGRRLVTAIDGSLDVGDQIGKVVHTFGAATAAPYRIEDGHLIASAGGEQFNVRIYRQGDRIMAANDHEFGYANYAVRRVEE